MFKLNLKIAWRNLRKNKIYAAVNIGGLAIALAAFIVIVLYVSYETSYDSDLPNYDRIYLVGRTLRDSKTEYTSPPVAKLIKNNFPEVIAAGRARYTGFEFPINSDQGRVYSSKALQLEFETARMFGIWPDTGFTETKGMGLELYVPKLFFKQLFPNEGIRLPKLIAMGPKNAGQGAEIRGLLDRDDAHSNIKFDILALGKDISFSNKAYADNSLQTYILVKEGTDIIFLQKKINTLYKEELKKAGLLTAEHSMVDGSAIYLDPLKNLHLKPSAGNGTNYKIIMALFWLSLLILVIACINFTSLTIAQATRRAKEVGVKKVMGAYRFDLTLQFLTEIFIQCLLALVFGLLLAELLLPIFNNLFNTPLSLWTNGFEKLVWQLPLILLGVTAISGVYPALVLSGYKPVTVLKGNLQSSYQTLWLRNILLSAQFSLAIVFIVSLLIVNDQLKYMKTEEVGFKPQQVIYVKNIQFYNNPIDFELARNKIMNIPGVNFVTVASDIPDGSRPNRNTYQLNGKKLLADFVDVDFDYFEALNIKFKMGRSFAKQFGSDSINSAILNETAAVQFGGSDLLGKVISGCDMDYKIVGVVKDVKAQGFETAVAPTVYMMKNPCDNRKIKVMINIDQNSMASVVATLRSQWSDINRLDGEDFRYEFLDELYGRLFKKQEQLRSVFFFAAILTIFIAVLGLFAFAKYMTNNRLKEIAIRKVLGAGNFDILKLLNTSFLMMVMIANCISCPLAYILTKKWLDTFAYRVDIPMLPFVISAVVTILLTILTVSVQAVKALKTNPAKALTYE